MYVLELNFIVSTFNFQYMRVLTASTESTQLPVMSLLTTNMCFVSRTRKAWRTASID